MISKNYLFVFFASFFIAGFIFLALPDTGYAQDVCCLLPDATCIQTTETVCTSTDVGGTDLGDGLCGDFRACAASDIGCCDSKPSTEQCDSPITRSECIDISGFEQFFTGGVCEAQAIRCTTGPNIPGCCQLTTDTVGTCNDNGTEKCDDEGPPAFPINGGVCIQNRGFHCQAPQGGCCVFHKNDCAFLSVQTCAMEGGDFPGANVLCSEVAECNVVISPIPTLNQWGLIAMAGLLGLFGLFIIIRRHRYNVG